MLGVFLDLETTGLDPTRHRVVDIALKAYNLQSGKLLGSYETIVQQNIEIWKQADPESLAINGFTFEHAQTGQLESLVSNEIKQFLQTLNLKRGKAVFIGQNSSFDRAFFAQLIPVYDQEQLRWPYHWLDLASMYWALNPPTDEEISLSKNTIAAHYNIPPEPLPHKAMNGVDHLIHCYNAVLNRELAT